MLIICGCLAALCLPAGCGDDDPGQDGGSSYPDFGGGPWPDQGSGSCSSTNCSGCCQASAYGSTCESGLSNVACGFGGSVCKPCSLKQTCQQGACAAAKVCDSTTCASGCCDSSGKCQAGTSDTVCGTAGAACQACATGKECGKDQKCATKGPAMYKVTLVSAKITGSTWLICGFAELSECDLYVNLKVGNKTAKSTTKVDTNKPLWNEYMLTETDANLIKDFQVEVRDDDPIGSVQIGKCSPSISTSTLTSGKLVKDCGDAKQVTFSFTRM